MCFPQRKLVQTASSQPTSVCSEWMILRAETKAALEPTRDCVLTTTSWRRSANIAKCEVLFWLFWGAKKNSKTKKFHFVFPSPGTPLLLSGQYPSCDKNWSFWLSRSKPNSHKLSDHEKYSVGGYNQVKGERIERRYTLLHKSPPVQDTEYSYGEGPSPLEVGVHWAYQDPKKTWKKQKQEKTSTSTD